VSILADLSDIRTSLGMADALTGASDHGSTKARYAHDPDGIEFEVCWLVPDESVTAELAAGGPPTRPLVLAAEIRRYGADTPSGARADQRIWEQVFGSSWRG